MGDVTTVTPASAQRVLRNTYALLGLTLAFSALVAGVAMSLKLPHPGILVTLVGFYGLFFLVNKTANSGKGVLAVFALTGFMGYTLGPTLNAVMSLPGGSAAITNALAATAAAFLGLSAIALTTKRDFSFMGKFLMIGMLTAMVLGLGAIFFEIPALSLAVSGMVVLLASGMILFETSRIVNGGETNYVMATVGLFVSIYNLFSSLLMLFGLGGGSDD
ncbi:Bax inhibitor-1/YccA family protein [Aquabacterium sp.]|uniref:Bax inhibitor-1/YccA family protein n=1 Tax=Aquabacterium sp. TaxID=1872578 RepID=UPI0039B74EC0